jgi:hypothetical protein
MSIFAPLLIYFSAIATLCGSIALAAAILLAAPPSESVAIEGKMAPIPAKFTRAADRKPVQPATTKAEAAPISLVTPAAASIAAPLAPPVSAPQKGLQQKRAAAPRKKPAAIAQSRPHQLPARALGYAAAPDAASSFFPRGE